MTPARFAEIRAYIARLDLDQLPPETVEQAIIRDLWEALPEAWDEGSEHGWEAHEISGMVWHTDDDPNPYRADVS